MPCFPMGRFKATPKQSAQSSSFVIVDAHNRIAPIIVDHLTKNGATKIVIASLSQDSFIADSCVGTATLDYRNPDPALFEVGCVLILVSSDCGVSAVLRAAKQAGVSRVVYVDLPRDGSGFSEEDIEAILIASGVDYTILHNEESLDYRATDGLLASDEAMYRRSAEAAAILALSAAHVNEIYEVFGNRCIRHKGNFSRACENLVSLKDNEAAMLSARLDAGLVGFRGRC
eukprot:Blabericola_migrator_1__8614@NODE_4510_length_1113_cov_348_282983_g2793_i0_p1_GENE_NODE_4510_length_1113_cov_348_282983_g2793_i0NODE_4510_length_1113_cov_348_282983_g2793_i0_p1_ORF_typecomplete_len230_score32_81NAD_binding_10/PF13460_6/9_9e06NmrA/PF05368_13/2_7e05Trp_syntA/PF00290_20/4_7e02Trp_syntA/PF00290_20/0_047His_biosynth/PF00977_21/0_16_NODE_4510_length_1113_cov_348_282983_g2793_i0199888